MPIDTPVIDWAGLSPYLVLLGGVAVAMLVSVLLRGTARNAAGALVAGLSFAGSAAAWIVLYTDDDTPRGLIADAIVRDRLVDVTAVILCVVGILAVLTGLEVTLSYVHIGPLTLPVLFVLMAVKFIMVALFFMHLRFDSTWFNAAFWSGLLFSLGVYIGALATFKFFLS